VPVLLHGGKPRDSRAGLSVVGALGVLPVGIVLFGGLGTWNTEIEHGRQCVREYAATGTNPLPAMS
jgi:hypothetical protein